MNQSTFGSGWEKKFWVYEDLNKPKIPKTWYFFNLFCVLTALLCISLAAFCWIFPEVDPREFQNFPYRHTVIQWMAFLLMLISVAHLLPLFFPKKPWNWFWGNILLWVGISGLFLPLAAPILYFWQTPQLKEFFGKEN